MLWGCISIFELLRKPHDRQTQGPGGVLSGREALGTTAGADAAQPEVLLRTGAKGTDRHPPHTSHYRTQDRYRSTPGQAQTSLRPDEARQDLAEQHGMFQSQIFDCEHFSRRCPLLLHQECLCRQVTPPHPVTLLLPRRRQFVLQDPS